MKTKLILREWSPVIMKTNVMGIMFGLYPAKQFKVDLKELSSFSLPVQLPEKCIKLHVLAEKDNVVVSDSFCGIGSTAIACKRLGISFIGFETEKSYLDEAVTRAMKELV